jgi:hypothetical protein
MFRTFQNTFISFFVIFQRFREWNPKYKGGIVLTGLFYPIKVNSPLIFQQQVLKVATSTYNTQTKT